MGGREINRIPRTYDGHCTKAHAYHPKVAKIRHEDEMSRWYYEILLTISCLHLNSSCILYFITLF